MGYSTFGKRGQAAAVALFITLASSCSKESLQENSTELLREEFGISVLTINILDVMNVPRNSPSGVPWQTRYNRITQWIGSSRNVPDVIVIQEAPGYWSCGNNPRRLPDYAAIDLLLDGIRDVTGEQYRIAYLISSIPPHSPAGDDHIGSQLIGTNCTGQGDRALLYRPSKLRNVLAVKPGSDAAFSSYATPLNQTYLAKSLQCCNPAADRADVCSVIDGPLATPNLGEFEIPMGTCATPMGLAFSRSRLTTRTTDPTRKIIDAVFSRFDLVKHPGHFVHVYNIHREWNIPWQDANPGGIAPVGLDFGSQNINQLVTDMEQRFGSSGTMLYPPILVGDFNYTPPQQAGNVPSSEAEWTEYWRQLILGSYFLRMDYGYVVGIDGALIGKRVDFPSKYPAYVNKGQSMPLLFPGDRCDTSPSLWSDHCGVYFRIEPVAPKS